MTTGVVLVAYNSGPLLVDSINGLLLSEQADLRIIVVDNGSQNDVFDELSAAGLNRPIRRYRDQPKLAPQGEILVWTLSSNHGFAGGVNHGLRAFMSMDDIDFIWVLNPDAIPQPHTAANLETHAKTLGRFGILSGRVFYDAQTGVIQSDGGRINKWTGVCVLFNDTLPAAEAIIPPDQSLDFLSGAHMFISKEYIRSVGYMPEDYFLYYEEVDWCLRRGDLTLHLVPNAEVYHVGGASIGSATVDQGPSPLSSYFMARARMKFVARFMPLKIPLALGYTLAKSLQLFLRGQTEAGTASLKGALRMPLPKALRKKIGKNTVGI